MTLTVTELSGQAEELLDQARELAVARGHALVGTEHVLLAMTRQSPDSFARRLLDEVGATEPLRAQIEAAIGEE
jgi:ATP-dependent Clp protease ATP-binding subunit ClpA